MNALVPASNVEAYRHSTDAAALCKEIVVATAQNIQGRNYVKVEGWQAIAIAHGCTCSARDVERVEGGVRAVGEIRRMSDGAVIAEAEGFVGEDEPTWFGGTVTAYGKSKTLPKRPDYAIRAMAQTRAISRAARSAFAHVVVMMNANLSTTPAEEVPMEGFEPMAGETVTVEKPPSKASLKRSGIYETLQAEMDACTTIDELLAWDKRRGPDIKALPAEWYQALGDRFEVTREKLETPEPEEAGAMDAEFRNVVGSPRREGVAGRDADRAAQAA